MLDAASLMVSRKARRAKTDRLDAEKLVRTLMAFWRGEPKVSASSCLASAQTNAPTTSLMPDMFQYERNPL
jgi:transposase